VLEGAVATLECALHDVADGGDHRILVGRVLAVEHAGVDVDPLLFYRGGFFALGRGALVYHRDGAEPFGGCCLGTAPAGVAVAPPALRRAVAQLRLRGARLLVDPREPEPLGPASLELDVASTVELRAAA
jgi:hypothetical protein